MPSTVTVRDGTTRISLIALDLTATDEALEVGLTELARRIGEVGGV
jgi:hypothetical protein